MSSNILGSLGSKRGKPGNSTTEKNKFILLVWADVLIHSTEIWYCATVLLGRRDMVGEWYPEEFARRGWRGALCYGAGLSSTAEQLKPTWKGSRPLPAPSALRDGWKSQHRAPPGLHWHCSASETWIIQVSPWVHFSGAPNGHAVDFCLLHLIHDLWLTSRFHAFKVPLLVLLLLCNNPVSRE